jgi:tetraacyldisaccharide 4'-kinase
VAFCGVGQPSRFRLDLEQERVEIVAFRAYRDHHPYGRGELRELEGLARAHGAALVTTEKDLVRLGPLPQPVPAVLALRIEAEVLEAAVLLDALARVTAQARR